MNYICRFLCPEGQVRGGAWVCVCVCVCACVCVRVWQGPGSFTCVAPPDASLCVGGWERRGPDGVPVPLCR
jgi:hypothetical protein